MYDKTYNRNTKPKFIKTLLKRRCCTENLEMNKNDQTSYENAQIKALKRR